MQTGKIILALLIAALLLVSPGAAQTKSKLKSRNLLLIPRVSVIKNYQATGMMTGCGNLYFVFPGKKESLEEEYVFLARKEGRDGWMNLDGRDTRLKLLKPKTFRKGLMETKWQYDYRAGKTLISVLVRNNKLESDDDYPFLMTITLKNGSSVKRVKAIGYSDC
jgi:hypothetical protein